MMVPLARAPLLRLCVAVLVAASCSQAVARDDVWKPAQDNAAWRNECGACHLAFPPGLLSSDDWLVTMAHLEDHFGVDASLEPEVLAEISLYLKQNGASNPLFGRRDEVPRITTTQRFEDKHRSAIRLWLKGQVKSLSDCGACHQAGGALP